jgi:hypothetical protein
LRENGLAVDGSEESLPELRGFNIQNIGDA